MRHDGQGLGSGRFTARPGMQLGPYRVLGNLGQGGMGAVLHVFDTNGQRELALKLLATEHVTARHLERFRREGNLTASLKHPGIITVHDAGVVDGHPYLAYELVRGRDLATALDDLSRDEALAILLQVSEAVGHAHSHGVIHRDLKPANILIGDDDGRARVADFGLAHAAGLERLTLTGALVGTPTYMAPEQVGGDRDTYGPHTDVWALGVLLYRILTGGEPFQADGLIELAAQIADSAPRPPRGSDSSISVALEAVCLKALQKSHTGRYPDANAFAADLRSAMDRRLSQVAALQEHRRGRRRAVGLGLLALVGVGAVAVAVALATTPPEATTPSTAGRIPSDRAHAARERLNAQLERALQLRSAADLKALQRLLPELGDDGLARVRAARLEAVEALAGHEPLRPCPDHAKRLRAFARLLPGEPPPAQLHALATASVRAIARQVQSELPLLDCWADAGARLSDRQLAADLSEALRPSLDPARLRPYWDALVAFSRLDVPLGTFLLNGIQGAPPPWGQDIDDPWRAYVALRVRTQDLRSEVVRSLPDVMRELEQLVQILRGKRPPSLGPIHWANTACRLNDADEDVFGSLLSEAVQRDPMNPTALRYLSKWLIKRDPARAVELAQRARDAYTKQGLKERISTLWEWPFVVRSQARVLVRTGRRDMARKVYAELRTAAPGDATRLRQDHPWLDPEPKRKP